MQHSLLILGAWIRRTKCILIMMSKEMSTKIVNLLIPGARVVVVGSWRGEGDKRGRVKITCMYNFDDVCQYKLHWAIMQLSSATIDFYLFYDGTVEIQIMSPSDKNSM